MRKKTPHGTHGYVISDLHICAPWSSVELYMDEIRTAAGNADFFVFNGDIFDFRWSTLGSAVKTAEFAVSWFRDLKKEFGSCRFFYILGNHDAHIKLLEPLAKFAESTPSFFWSDAYVIIDSSLFMHGDLIFTMKNKSPYRREKYKRNKPRPGMLRRTYHRAIEMGAQRLVSKMHAKKRCARYVLKVLKEHEPEYLEGITDIYIGHTHVGFSDFQYGGYTFHNTGSAVHDLHCNMLKVR